MYDMTEESASLLTHDGESSFDHIVAVFAGKVGSPIWTLLVLRAFLVRL